MLNDVLTTYLSLVTNIVTTYLSLITNIVMTYLALVTNIVATYLSLMTNIVTMLLALLTHMITANMALLTNIVTTYLGLLAYIVNTYLALLVGILTPYLVLLTNIVTINVALLTNISTAAMEQTQHSCTYDKTRLINSATAATWIDTHHSTLDPTVGSVSVDEKPSQNVNERRLEHQSRQRFTTSTKHEHTHHSGNLFVVINEYYCSSDDCLSLTCPNY